MILLIIIKILIELKLSNLSVFHRSPYMYIIYIELKKKFLILTFNQNYLILFTRIFIFYSYYNLYLI